MTKQTIPNHILEMNDQILKNALEIIHETGLLKNEVVQLNIGDVKQNGSIVSSIQPVPGPYTKSFQKAPIIVSNRARNVLANHISYLNSSTKFNSPASPLFPNLITKSRYEEEKLWNDLSNFCKYYEYERHRQMGIHRLCWEMSRNGYSRQQIIDAAHQFSRYKNIKRTTKLVDEEIGVDPIEYDKIYDDCRNAVGWLKHCIEVRPDSVEQVYSKIKSKFEQLFERDKGKILSMFNKHKSETGKELILEGKSLKLINCRVIINRKKIASRARILSRKYQ